MGGRAHPLARFRGRPRGHAGTEAPDPFHVGDAPRGAPAGRSSPGGSGRRGDCRPSRLRERGRSGGEPGGGEAPARRHPRVGERVGHARGPGAHGASLRLERLAAMDPPNRRLPRHSSRLPSGPGARRRHVVGVALRRRHSRVGPRRRTGLRGHGRPRPPLLLSRRHAHHRGHGRDLPSDIVADPAGHSAPHRLRIRPGRERRQHSPPAVLSLTPRVDARRPRGHRHRALRSLHHVHRGLRRDHHRPRWARLSDAPGGRLPRWLLPGPGHGRGKPGAPLPAEPSR